MNNVCSLFSLSRYIPYISSSTSLSLSLLSVLCLSFPSEVLGLSPQGVSRGGRQGWEIKGVILHLSFPCQDGEANTHTPSLSHLHPVIIQRHPVTTSFIQTLLSMSVITTQPTHCLLVSPRHSQPLLASFSQLYQRQSLPATPRFTQQHPTTPSSSSS